LTLAGGGADPDNVDTEEVIVVKVEDKDMVVAGAEVEDIGLDEDGVIVFGADEADIGMDEDGAIVIEVDKEDVVKPVGLPLGVVVELVVPHVELLSTSS